MVWGVPVVWQQCYSLSMNLGKNVADGWTGRVDIQGSTRGPRGPKKYLRLPQSTKKYLKLQQMTKHQKHHENLLVPVADGGWANVIKQWPRDEVLILVPLLRLSRMCWTPSSSFLHQEQPLHDRPHAQHHPHDAQVDENILSAHLTESVSKDIFHMVSR